MQMCSISVCFYSENKPQNFVSTFTFGVCLFSSFNSHFSSSKLSLTEKNVRFTWKVEEFLQTPSYKLNIILS